MTRTPPSRTARTLRLTLGLLTFFMLHSAQPASAQAGARRDSTVRLTLLDAIRLAARQNTSVESARYRVEAARARVTQRRADLLPNLSGSASERSSMLNSAAAFPIDFPSAPGTPPLFDPQGSLLGPLNVFDARVRVTQPLLDLAARERVQGARTSVEAATADVGNAANIASSVAANSYLTVLRADAVYTARVADSTLAAELLGIAQEQLSAGTGVALDVTRARSQLTGARVQLIVARNERDRTRVDLARSLGLPLGSVTLTDSLASLPLTADVNESAAFDAATRTRKDLQSLQLQAKAARQQLTAIHGERLPTVGVFADEGQSQRNGRSFLPTYDLGVQLSVPIFDGFRREGREQEQTSVARELEAREHDLRTQVEADVRTSVLNLRSSAEGVAAARERLSLAEQEVSQARERFQAGVAGNADVIAASITLNAARTGLVDALTSYQASRVAFARAQGDLNTLQ